MALQLGKGTSGTVFEVDASTAVKKAPIIDCIPTDGAVAYIKRETLTELAAVAMFMECPRLQGVTIPYKSITACNWEAQICMAKGEMPLSKMIWNTRFSDRMRQLPRIYRDLLRGLHLLHEHGIAHCDFKSSNVVLLNFDGSWTPRIVDFGSCHFYRNVALYGPSAEDKSTPVQCTYPYAPPELFVPGEEDSELDLCKVDAYSLGALLFEFIYKGLLYDHEKVRGFQSVRALHNSGELPEIKHLYENPCPPPGVPEWIYEDMLALLRRDPRERASIKALHEKRNAGSVLEIAAPAPPYVLDPPRDIEFWWGGANRRAAAVDHISRYVSKSIKAIAVNLADRLVIALRRPCTEEDIDACLDLAICLLLNDGHMRLPHGPGPILFVLHTLRFRIYSDTTYPARTKGAS